MNGNTRSRRHVALRRSSVLVAAAAVLGGLYAGIGRPAAPAPHAAIAPRVAGVVIPNDHPDLRAVALRGDLSSPAGADPVRGGVLGVNRAPAVVTVVEVRQYPRIVVSRIGIDLPIIEGDGGAPARNIAAHYPGTAIPGDFGNSYIYAHDLPGMFLHLHDVRSGDVVVVEMDPNTSYRYQVSEIHPSVDATDFEYTQPTDDERITLQTCNGWRDYDPRFVVVALRLPS
ncbi:MAG: sortase [Candidatus Dormibacteria bacterium]